MFAFDSHHRDAYDQRGAPHKQRRKEEMWEMKGKKEPVLKIGNYVLGKTLGTGTFGKVKVAEHELLEGHKVAVKILNKQKIKNLNSDTKIQREIQILKLFRHPHVIKLYDVIETPTDIFLIMEFGANGELFDFIVKNKRLSEAKARKFFQQIVAGVEYCHSHMVVHRDLKPENLLLDQYNNVKVADFGLSNIMTDGEFLTTSCGSPNYAAPEVISGKLYAGPEVDVWSCGVVLYALLCGHLPFDDEYIPALFDKIRGGIFERPMHVSSECQELLCSMLQVDPLKRITISEIRQHPWYRKDLPKYIQKKPAPIQRGITTIDPHVLVGVMQKLDLKDKQKTIEELKQDKEDENPSALVVAYHLMYDRFYKEKRLNRERSKELSHSSSGEQTEHNESLLLSPPMNLRDQRLAFMMEDDAEDADDVWSRGGLDSSTMTVTKGPLHRQMWKLGVLSSAPPREVMNNLLIVLKEVEMKWKFLTTIFQLRCVFGEGDDLVKMSVQLFQVRTGKYLLDIKRLGGGVFRFFDLNHKILTLFDKKYETTKLNPDGSGFDPKSRQHKRTPSLRRQAIHATLYPSAPNSPATPTTTPPHLSPNSSPLHLSPHHPSSPHRKRSVSQQSSPSPPISSPSSPPHQPPTCVSLFASPSTPPLSSPSTPPISVEYSLSSAPPPSPRHALLQKQKQNQPQAPAAPPRNFTPK